jgi:hypothetical protein
MEHSRLQEAISNVLETMSSVKPKGAYLCVQIEGLLTLLLAEPKKGAQEYTTDPAVTPWLHDRQAPNLAFGSQPAGSDRLLIGSQCEHVETIGIYSIPLQRSRNALFFDKYVMTNFSHRLLIGRPLSLADKKFSTRGVK